MDSTTYNPNWSAGAGGRSGMIPTGETVGQMQARQGAFNPAQQWATATPTTSTPVAPPQTIPMSTPALATPPTAPAGSPTAATAPSTFKLPGWNTMQRTPGMSMWQQAVGMLKQKNPALNPFQREATLKPLFQQAGISNFTENY